MNLAELGECLSGGKQKENETQNEYNKRICEAVVPYLKIDMRKVYAEYRKEFFIIKSPIVP